MKSFWRTVGQPADLKFPLDFVRDKIFLTGIGSGKSWTGGLLMEKSTVSGFNSSVLMSWAHGGLSQLPNVEELSPKGGECQCKGLMTVWVKNPHPSSLIFLTWAWISNNS